MKLILFVSYTIFILAIFTLAYMGLIPLEISKIPFYDSIGHFVLYGLWAYFAGMAFSKKIFIGVSVPKGILIVLLIAILEESLQSLSSIRTFSLSDMYWGFIGIAVAFLVTKKTKTSL